MRDEVIAEGNPISGWILPFCPETFFIPLCAVKGFGEIRDIRSAVPVLIIFSQVTGKTADVLEPDFPIVGKIRL